MALPNLTGTVAVLRPIDRSRDPAIFLVVDHDPLFLNVVSTEGGVGSLVRNVKLQGTGAYEVVAYIASAEGFIAVASSVADSLQVALSNDGLRLVGSAREELETTLRILLALIRATQAGLQRETADPAFEQLLREHATPQPQPQPVRGERFTEQPFINVGVDNSGESVRIGIIVDHPDPAVRRRVADMIFEQLGGQPPRDRNSWGK